MLTWALTFFNLGIISSVLGLTGICLIALVVSKFFFSLFLILTILTVIVRLVMGPDFRFYKEKIYFIEQVQEI